jgi:HSP20 family protein
MNNFRNQEQETERKCNWHPATNITEEEQAFKVEMAVPGFSKKDFRISLEKDIMTVSSERESKEPETNQFRMREFARRDFCRSFRLSEEVDQENIKAEYKNGILTLTLPKKEEVRVKKEIQVL